MDYSGGYETYTGPEANTKNTTSSSESTYNYIGPSAPENDYDTVPNTQTTPSGARPTPSAPPRSLRKSQDNDGYVYVIDDKVGYSKPETNTVQNNSTHRGRPLPSTNIYQEPYMTNGTEIRYYSQIQEPERNNNQQLNNNSVIVLGKTRCVVVTVAVALLVIALVVGLTYLLANSQGKSMTEATPTRSSTDTVENKPSQPVIVRDTTTKVSPASTQPSIPSPSTSSKLPSTRFRSTTQASGVNQATTSSSIPQECLEATNFTRPWRTDTKGSDIHPGNGRHSYNGYACDLHSDLEWFRFTGEAGNRMLNTCPEAKSCGSENPLWTDADLPDEVGVIWEISVYQVYLTYCRLLTKLTQVMRCSTNTDHDLIYKYVGSYEDTCSSSFCGMH